MEQKLKKIAQSGEYKKLNKFFDNSYCNATNLIGPVCSLCKESGAETFNEWYEYYLFNTTYYSKLWIAATKLHDYNEITKAYSFDVCYKVMLTLAIYQTWVGCKMEMEAKRLLEDSRWDISFAGRQEDNKYAIDLIIKKNGKIIYGVQVKPLSYYYLHIQKNTDLHLLNREKNNQFKNKYNCRIKYIYYDDKFNFDQKVIGNLRNSIGEEVEKCETM